MLKKFVSMYLLQNHFSKYGLVIFLKQLSIFKKYFPIFKKIIRKKG
jgi:hypothetical protein